MPTYFLDSSAIAKRYVAEVGSGRIASLTDPIARNVCWLAAVTRVEVVAGLYRRHRMGHIAAVDAQRSTAAFLHVQHIAEHGVTKEEVEEVLSNPSNPTDQSHSSGRPATFGWTSTGKHIIVIWEEVQDDPLTAFPVTAYETPPPTSR